MPYIPSFQIRAANGWFSPKEAAAKLQIGLSTLQRLKSLYPPSAVCGARAVYTTDDLNKITAHLDQETKKSAKASKYERLATAGYLSVKHAADKFGVKYITWMKAMTQGRVPRPQHRIGAQRYYLESEAAEHAKTFLTTKRPEGVYDTREAAKLLGVSRTTVSKHANEHAIGMTPANHRRWFTDDDIEKLRVSIYPFQAKLVDRVDEYIRLLQTQFNQQLQHYVASQFEQLQAKVEDRLEQMAKKK